MTVPGRAAADFAPCALISIGGNGIFKCVAAPFDGDANLSRWAVRPDITKECLPMGDARDTAKKKKAVEKKSKAGKGAPAKTEEKAPRK